MQALEMASANVLTYLFYKRLPWGEKACGLTNAMARCIKTLVVEQRAKTGRAEAALRGLL